MSAPYGLSSTSFRVNRQIAKAVGTQEGGDPVQALTALAVLKGLARELQARGYDVTPPVLAKNAAIASFTCILPLMKLDLFLTASEPLSDWVECKLGPLGWRRTWKSPTYEEIWREWVQLRTVVEEYLTKTLHVEPLRWERARAYRVPTA